MQNWVEHPYWDSLPPAVQTYGPQKLKGFYTGFCIFEMQKNINNQKPYLKTNKKWIKNVHHFIPRFVFKACMPGIDPKELRSLYDNPVNCLLMSKRTHIISHYFRYKQLNTFEDKAAVYLLKNNRSYANAILAKKAAYASHAVLKATKKGAWDPIAQKIKSDLAMAKENARSVRQDTGKIVNKAGKAIGGRKVGSTYKGGIIGGRRAHENKYLFKTDIYEWSYKGLPTVCIWGCNTGGMVWEILNQIYPNPKFTNRRVHRIIQKGVKLYGWSCKKIQLVAHVPRQI